MIRAWHFVRLWVLLVVLVASGLPRCMAAPAIKELFHNEDETNSSTSIRSPAGKAGETYRPLCRRDGPGRRHHVSLQHQRPANQLSQPRVGRLLGRLRSGRPRRSALSGPHRRKNGRARPIAKLVGSMLAVHQQGIDYPARVIAALPA